MSIRPIFFALAALTLISQPVYAGFDIYTGFNEKGQTVYEFLGISSRVDKEELKEVKKRMIELHPERNPLGEEEFKALSEAFDLIKTEERRENYSRLIRGERPQAKQNLDHEYFGKTESVSKRMSDDLESLNQSRLVGSGKIRIARLDQFDKEFSDPEMNEVRSELEKIFSKKTLEVPEWAYMASMVSDPDLMKKIYIVVVPEGVDEQRGSMTASLHIHANNGEFTTFYNGADIHPEQANSIESRARASREYLEKFSSDFRNSYVLYVKPSSLKRIGKEKDFANIVASSLGHELSHVADTELLKRWSALNRRSVEKGMPGQTFFNLVAKVKDGQTFLSSGFFNVFLESRGYFISALLEEKLGPSSKHSQDKYWLEAARQVEEVRGWLINDSMGFLTKMGIDYLQIPHRSIQGEDKVRAIGNQVFSKSSAAAQIAASLLRSGSDCEDLLRPSIRLLREEK